MTGTGGTDDAPLDPAADATVEVMVDAAVAATSGGPGGGPDAVVRVAVSGPGRLERGATLAVRDGRVVGPAGQDEPDVTFTVAAGDAGDLTAGRMAPTEAFMRGRLKTTGEPGLVLALLAAADGGAWERWVEAMAGSPGR